MILRCAALAASALILFGAPAASAETWPGAEMELAVTTADGYRYSADLTCMPRGGTHSDNWTACDALRQTRGDLDHLPVQDWRVCTEEFDPVTFTATGQYKGQQVVWEKTFSNECQGHRETGGLFDF